MADKIADNLASNMRALREAAGITQSQMAKRAQLPRPTWANLEAGGANPTLAVLVKVGRALRISVEELLAPPSASARLYRADELKSKKRGGVQVRKLIPDPLVGLEIDRMELPPGGRMIGIPHVAGTREYLTCEVGQVELVASGETWRLAPGDVVVFRGDQRPSYFNFGRSPTIAFGIGVLVPPGA